ncbi:MAG: redoxin domain-containing protein [Bacteroidaceae bacterium]|nr:redoxin domain-containing protein [Bacteroidaceae bacterium]
MRKFLILLLSVLMGGSMYSQCVIKADLKDVTGDTVFVQIVKPDFTGIEKTDTLKIKKGKFTIQNNDSKMRLAICRVKTTEGEKRLSIYLVPGEKGTVKGTTEKNVWSGSTFYKEYQELDDATDSIQEKMYEVGYSYHSQVDAGANADSLRKIIDPIYDGLKQQLNDAKMNFINTHPNSGACVTILMGLDDSEKALNVMSSIDADSKYSYFVDFVKANIEREKVREAARKNVEDGKMAPDFTLKSIDGTDLSLSSLRGKYLILDFWGSWCIWCIKGFPELKKYYEKYGDRLEILGVDCSDTEEKWKEAVAKHELKWKHVYNPKDSKVPEMYAITGFPTKIVIDPEGKIVKTVVGENPVFYEFLDELFK